MSIRHTDTGAILVEFEQIGDPRGQRKISLGLDAYLLLVKESTDMESLRCLVFEYGRRERAAAKTAAAR